MTCVVVCQLWNGLRPGVARTFVDELEWGSGDAADRMSAQHSCFQCEDAPCVAACPTGASFVADDGTVGVDRGRCIGCGVCVPSCPYGARTINRPGPYHFGLTAPAPYEDADPGRVGTAEKCDACGARRSEGLAPVCVKACPTGARLVGDLDDPADPIHAFVSECGASRVRGTSVFFADGGRSLEMSEVFRALGARRLVEERQRPDDEPAGNPAVLGAACVAGAACTAALAVRASRERKGEREPVPEEAQCSGA